MNKTDKDLILNLINRLKKMKEEKRDNINLEVAYDNAINNLEVLLNLLSSKKTCCIFGAAEASDFKLTVPEEQLFYKVQDIWDHPKKYYTYSGDSYYSFLKFLWIEYSDKTEIRLCDIIKC